MKSSTASMPFFGLPKDELQKLKYLSYAIHTDREAYATLEAYGLATSGRSRFGNWVRITEKGRELVQQLPPGSDAGAGLQAGYSCRGAVPRKRRDTASQARESAAITPPAAVLDVGAPTTESVVDTAKHAISQVTVRVLDYAKNSRTKRRGRTS